MFKEGGKGPLAVGQLLNLSVSQFSNRGREATGNKIVPVFQREEKEREPRNREIHQIEDKERRKTVSASAS